MHDRASEMEERFEKLAFSTNRFISKMAQDTAIVTMEDE